MSIGFGRTATQDLTHVGLVLAPRRAWRRSLAAAALAALALAAGAGIGYVVRGRAPPAVQESPAARREIGSLRQQLEPLRQQLEQARLAQRLADARGHELERQVDSLNQRLTQSQDELTFFRKAREGKH